MNHKRGELSAVVQYTAALNLPYLQACIKEAYRYHSSLGTNLPRVIPKGSFTIRGRIFLKEYVISIVENATLTPPKYPQREPLGHPPNPDVFGPDSNSFNPERWLDKERAKTMEYFLHGAGYNQCPGRNLTHFEINRLVATLVRDYDYDQIDPTTGGHSRTILLRRLWTGLVGQADAGRAVRSGRVIR
ncbi:cytochrome P450 [Aspergillus californicus]